MTNFINEVEVNNQLFKFHRRSMKIKQGAKMIYIYSCSSRIIQGYDHSLTNSQNNLFSKFNN